MFSTIFNNILMRELKINEFVITAIKIVPTSKVMYLFVNITKAIERWSSNVPIFILLLNVEFTFTLTALFSYTFLVRVFPHFHSRNCTFMHCHIFLQSVLKCAWSKVLLFCYKEGFLFPKPFCCRRESKFAQKCGLNSKYYCFIKRNNSTSRLMKSAIHSEAIDSVPQRAQLKSEISWFLTLLLCPTL